MFKAVNYRILIIVITSFLIACKADQSEKKKLESLPEPFRFHRKIEVKPGLIYDLFTWGRGDRATSGFLILRSDSTHQQFSTTSSELRGKPVEIWDMDLDTDGRPEIVLQVLLEKNISDLYIYEFDETGYAVQIKFPSLLPKP